MKLLIDGEEFTIPAEAIEPLGPARIPDEMELRRLIGCACPRAWWGVLPPPCPLHNPSPPTITTDRTS